MLFHLLSMFYEFYVLCLSVMFMIFHESSYFLLGVFANILCVAVVCGIVH